MSLEGKSQQEVAALAALSDSLLADPKTRGQFQRLVKVAKPGVSLPEIELEDKVAAAIRPLQDTNAQLVAEAEKAGCSAPPMRSTKSCARGRSWARARNSPSS
jgi:hypothetical protein